MGGGYTTVVAVVARDLESLDVFCGSRRELELSCTSEHPITGIVRDVVEALLREFRSIGGFGLFTKYSNTLDPSQVGKLSSRDSTFLLPNMPGGEFGGLLMTLGSFHGNGSSAWLLINGCWVEIILSLSPLSACYRSDK